MSCPNINSSQWKSLVAKIGNFEAMREFMKNGEEIPDAGNFDHASPVSFKSKRGYDEKLEEKYFINRETTAKDVLEKISPSDNALAPLAKKLMESIHLFNIPIRLVTKEEMTELGHKNFAGVYLHTGEILIREGSYFRGSSEATLLHEIIHAITTHFLLDNMDHPIVRDLGKMLTYLKDNKSQIVDQYGLTDPLELMTAFFTDGQFIKDLQNIAPSSKISGYKNMWEEILHWLADLFKLGKGSVYAEMFPMMSTIMQKSVTYRQQLNDNSGSSNILHIDRSDKYEPFYGQDNEHDTEYGNKERAINYQQQLEQYIDRNELTISYKDGIQGYAMSLSGAKNLAAQYQKSGYLYDQLSLRYNKTSGLLQIGPRSHSDIQSAAEEEATAKVVQSKEYKLNQIAQQHEALNTVRESMVHQAQKDTVTKLMNNLMSYKAALENDEHTVSVSKFMGGGTIKDGHLYKDFTEFGTFIHSIIEKIQDKAQEEGKSLTELLTPEMYEKLFDEHQEVMKTYNEHQSDINKQRTLNIYNLVEGNSAHQDVYQMAQRMIGLVQGYVDRGFTLIPETTVYGKGTYGGKTGIVNITGRIDMMAISPQGNIEVIDFKTKKMDVSADPDTVLREAWPPNPSNETFGIFSRDSKNTFDSWDIQLGMYQNLLLQTGIAVDKKTIIGLLYKGKRLKNASQEFDKNNKSMWTYDSFGMMTYESGEHTQYSELDRLRFLSNERKVNEAIPLNKQEEESKKHTGPKNYIFNLSEAEEKLLVKRLSDTNELERTKTLATLTRLRKENATPEQLKFWENRKETHKKIDEALKTKQDWTAPYKIGIAIQWLDENLAELVKESETTHLIGNIQERINKSNRLVNTAQGYSFFTDTLKDLLTSPNLPENEHARKVLDRISANVRQVTLAYTKLGALATVEILAQDLTGRNKERFSKEQEEALKPRLDSLRKELSALLASGGESTLKNSIYNSISNVVRSAMKVEGNFKNEQQRLELEIAKLELRMKGVYLTSDELFHYLESILDPEAISYIGDTTSAGTQLIAGASSSDRLLSAYVNRLKQAENNGQQQFVNYMEKHRMGEEFNRISHGRNGAAVSKPMSEVRNVLEYDEDGKEKRTAVLGFLNGITEDYYDVFTRYYHDINTISDKIIETPGDKSLKDSRTAIIKAHTEWKIQNCNMPYISEIYELDKMLPEEYKQARNDLYEEKKLLENSAGYNNVDGLDESVLDQIADIEIQLTKLRLDIILQNGDYEAYTDKMEEYYAYDTNYNYYNRMKNSKEMELTDGNGKLDQHRMNLWLAYNNDRIPTQDWYEKVSVIYDKLYAIIGDNEEVKELREKQREILNQYKRKGYVDTRYLTPDEIKTIDSIEEMINEAKKSNDKLSREEKDARKKVFDELNEIQTRELNPYYTKEFQARYAGVQQKWNLYLQSFKSEAGEDVERTMKQFMSEEENFSVWYNNNHTNTYESKMVSDQPLNPMPKKFNFISVPTKQEMTELKPIRRYSIRSIKEEAINEHYKEDIHGYPMPKGLTQVRGTMVEGSSNYLNPAYVRLKSNLEQFTYYDSFVSRYLDMQQDTTGRKLNFAFPGYEEKSFEDYNKNGMIDGIKSRFEIMKEKNFKVHGTFANSNSQYSTNEEKIRFKNNKSLPIGQQSTDGVASVIMWMREALINKSIAEIQPEAKAILSFLDDLAIRLSSSSLSNKDARLTGLQRVIDNAKFEYRKHIKGESKLDEGAMGKLVDTTLKMIGITRLGWDIPNQIGNLFSGNVQAFLGMSKSGQYTAKDYLYAKKMIEGRNGLIGAMIKDHSKISGKSHITKIFYYFNPLQKDLERHYDKTRNNTERNGQSILEGEPAFWIQDKGEVEIAATIMFAIMNNTRINVTNGKDSEGNVQYKKNADGSNVTINAYEAYKENEQGEVVIRDDVEWSKADEFALQKTIWSEERRTQGNYAAADKTMIEQGYVGRLLVYYRKYLAPSILNRFGRLQDNREAAEMSMGIYNAFFAAWKYYGPKQMMMSWFGSENDVTKFYSRKSGAAAREMLVSVMLLIIGNMLVGMTKGMGKDPDDNKVGDILMYNMLAVYLKVDNETRSIVPIPFAGGLDDYITTLGSFTNANRDILKLSSLLKHGGELMASQFDDNAALQKAAYYQTNTPLFDKGEAKIKKDIMDLTGYMNIYEIFNPKGRVDMGFKRR